MPQPNETLCDLYLPVIICVALLAVVVCQFIFNKNEF